MAKRSLDDLDDPSKILRRRQAASSPLAHPLGQQFEPYELRQQSRERWLVATQEATLLLINPPEPQRSYSDRSSSALGAEPPPLSVLGSMGEWKVASSNQTRWVTLSLGHVSRVTAVVLQSGSLAHVFSGWVTALRVAYSSAEECPAGDSTDWIEVERELLTGCSSDPVQEHRIFLREQLWAAHIKLTPTRWKVAAALASNEDLTPKISMRAAVLVTLERFAPPEASGLRRRRTEPTPGTASIATFFNLCRGPQIVARTDTVMPETTGALYLIAADGSGNRLRVGNLHATDSIASSESERSVGARLEFEDDYIEASRFLTASQECTVEVGEDQAAARPQLTLQPTELAYGCTRGARVSIASGVSHEEASGTVVSVSPSGEAIISVDNADTPRSFSAWANSHFAKIPRALCALRIDARPATIVMSPGVHHPPGTRLLVMRDGALVDAAVANWLGVDYGNRHTLVFADGTHTVDLNTYNHTVQRFESAAAFEACRAAYCQKLIDEGRFVEDAITGRCLKIEEQLLNITIASGDEAVITSAADLARLPAEDLVWELGARIAVGDRVRYRGRLGFVGFHNDEGALVTLGLEEHGRFYCGRPLGRSKCGGQRGSGRSCDSCRRFKHDSDALLSPSRARNLKLLHVEL